MNHLTKDEIRTLFYGEHQVRAIKTRVIARHELPGQLKYCLRGEILYQIMDDFMPTGSDIKHHAQVIKGRVQVCRYGGIVYAGVTPYD